MITIDNPRLAQLSTFLRCLDVGDQVIQGRAMLFSCVKRTADRKLATQIDRELERSPHLLYNSPIGPMQSADTKTLLVNLISALNEGNPDYDFSSLSAESFQLCPDLNTVVNGINHNLAIVVERVRSGFIGEMWTVIWEAVSVQDVEVYQYVGPVEHHSAGHSSDQGLWSFDFFFHDRYQKRILYLTATIRGKMNRGLREWRDSDSERAMSDVAGYDSVASMSQSDKGDQLMEGEYEFQSDYSDDDMDVDY
mmetsp:Transcript_9044/g.19771  ORF Transcript_9044/g.19771 Transcript_9044/m.19771 type:complete len:251 (+) Transcript_9044:117-869(+)|eukprot:CAMPEP_0204284090 /NCGR_PEP_ID=MMETSP0468-20130131/47717_1 /ASSEMBLY_ACC=CAM_ASM_000383 /TAXON_ID=2969 /ORGANISM="Oxyrrhis marina" /LENGTH=250 /DNA_ID=CAMNT_0051261787 /DNA_START=28 /DNA_END=780 /DNA_ORIENTATION=-